MATQRLITVHSLKDLDLDPETFRTLSLMNVNVKELVLAARNDATWQAYLPNEVHKPAANRLTCYPGISATRAQGIIRAVDRAGLLLHESKRSRGARWLTSMVLGSPKIFIEHYETLENMSPEALAAVEKVVQNALNDQERQIVNSYFGLKNGYYRTLEESAHKANVTKELAGQLLSRAISRLRHPSCCPKLKVATCFSHEALVERTVKLQRTIHTLQQELELLKANSPYSELRIRPNLPIEDLDINMRTSNTLARAGICTIKQLAECSDADLLAIRNFGPRQLEEVRHAEAQLINKSQQLSF